jgi:hypothetical protein
VLKRSVYVLVAIWVLAVGLGLHGLMRYKASAGSTGRTPDTWPATHGLALADKKPVLVMFAHPRCQCTRASLGELEALVARAREKFEATVVFYQPENSSEAWSKSALVETARAMPGVRVILDTNGKIAAKFGAETSGHTIVYGSDGKLLFSGGITGSRGHLGPNTGFDDVLRMVSGDSLRPAAPSSTPVFGCGLIDRCTTTPTITQSN